MQHTVSFPFLAGQTGVVGCVNAVGSCILLGLSSPGCTNPALAYLVTQRPGQCDTTNAAQVPDQPAAFQAWVGAVVPPALVYTTGMYSNWNTVGDVPILLGGGRAVAAEQCLVVAVENAPENGAVRLHFDVAE